MISNYFPDEEAEGEGSLKFRVVNELTLESIAATAWGLGGKWSCFDERYREFLIEVTFLGCAYIEFFEMSVAYNF